MFLLSEEINRKQNPSSWFPDYNLFPTPCLATVTILRASFFLFCRVFWLCRISFSILSLSYLTTVLCQHLFIWSLCQGTFVRVVTDIIHLSFRSTTLFLTLWRWSFGRLMRKSKEFMKFYSWNRHEWDMLWENICKCVMIKIFNEYKSYVRTYVPGYGSTTNRYQGSWFIHKWPTGRLKVIRINKCVWSGSRRVFLPEKVHRSKGS